MYYLKELKRIKDLGQVDFIKFDFNGKKVKLKLVDTSNDTILLLTQWRNKFWDAFPVKFTATPERTRLWLENQVINQPDRILFMIYLNDEKIGHIGTYRYNATSNSAEIDSVLRAVRKDSPGLMKKITEEMIKWMFEELNLLKVLLKVFSDNYKAINLYERCKMLTIGHIPLKRTFTKDGWQWEEVQLKNESEYAERYFSIMEITRESYFTVS